MDDEYESYVEEMEEEDDHKLDEDVIIEEEALGDDC